MKLAIIYGTRPELVKLAPVYNEALATNDIDAILLSVGQHNTILKQVEEYFGINPDIRLELMIENQTLAALSSKILTNVTECLKKIEPDYILVQGDTTTALMSALATSYMRLPIGHIEAGLRSHDIENPYPEEMNRILISKMASYHYAPTNDAKSNLINEGVLESKISITGNTVIDAIKYVLRDTKLKNHSETDPTILVTLHRRENLGERLKQICMAIGDIAKLKAHIKILFPMHPNPKVRAVAKAILGNLENVFLTEPLDYKSMLEQMSLASLIISDSGGIQEEASYFGIPTLICRRKTERNELIEMGLGKLVGDERKMIVDSAIEWIEKPPMATSMDNPFGDGFASKRIISHLLERS